MWYRGFKNFLNYNEILNFFYEMCFLPCFSNLLSHKEKLVQGGGGSNYLEEILSYFIKNKKNISLVIFPNKMAVTKIVSKNEFEEFINRHSFVTIHFYAEWASQCESMNSVLEEMAKLDHFKKMHFAKIEAEVVPEVSVKYKITAVPTILIFKDGDLAETVNGANPAELMNKINQTARISPITLPITVKQTAATLDERLKTLITLADVMVFMKGNPLNPRCGFSRTLVGILNQTGIPYQTFDILNDEDVRQGLKKFSNWPTYPQVYVKGELIGGLDIIQELHKSGELISTLRPKRRKKSHI